MSGGRGPRAGGRRQRTEDGVITVTAIPAEISLEDTVAFVDQFADAAGAA